MPELLLERVDGALHLVQLVPRLTPGNGEVVGVGEGGLEVPLGGRAHHDVDERGEPVVDLVAAGRVVMRQPAARHLDARAVEDLCPVRREEGGDVEGGFHAVMLPMRLRDPSRAQPGQTMLCSSL